MRERVIGICTRALREGIKGENEGKKREEEYWVRATLVEALLAVGKTSESELHFELAKKMAPEAWMIDSTEEQLAKLRALQP